MNIRTIVSDLDRTLLNNNGAMSDDTVRVLRACTQRGIRVILSSGRAPASMRPFVEAIGGENPYLSCNGALIVGQDHQILEKRMLPAALAREICAYLTENGFYVQVYRDAYYYYAAECDLSKNYRRATGMTGAAVGDLQAFLTFDVPKVLSVNYPEEVARFYPICRERYAGRAIFSISMSNYLEVTHPDATKGSALRRLSKCCPLRPEETMVFGDSLNDISMLEYAEHSVAVANARDEVKAIARYHCGANTEDGVARFIEQNVLT